MKTILLKVENNFKTKKEIKQSMKTFLRENKEKKLKKKDSTLYYYNKNDIKKLEKKLIDIEELKEDLKQKGLNKKERYGIIAKALIKNSDIKLEIAKLEKDNQENIIEYIQPIESYRTIRCDSTDMSMRIKKSKGVINRHCYR